MLEFVKKNPVITVIIVAIAVYFLFIKPRVDAGGADVLIMPIERFSSCLQRKQIYLNSCSEMQPEAHADVNIEKRFGKLYIFINANLPMADGGIFHTSYGAYHAFLINSKTNESVNIGTLVRHGDRWYKLATALLGQYDGYDRLDVYHQVEDYEPKRVLTGSITKQNTSSAW
jgi:hypothetical protein